MAVFKDFWEENMINWRSLVLAARPGIPIWLGVLVTQTLAVLTIVAVVMVTRGRWMRDQALFALHFTLVVIATLIVAHHSFEFGPVLLTVPLAAFLSTTLASTATRLSVALGVLVTLYFVLTLQLPQTARLLTVALLGCFASMLITAWRYQKEERQLTNRGLPVTSNRLTS
jgi:hypothetical protein